MRYILNTVGIIVKATILEADKVKLTFFCHSGSNHSTVYLHRATSANLSNNPSLYACLDIKGVWLMWGKVRTLQYGDYIA